MKARLDVSYYFGKADIKVSPDRLTFDESIMVHIRLAAEKDTLYDSLNIFLNLEQTKELHSQLDEVISNLRRLNNHEKDNIENGQSSTDSISTVST